MAGPDMPAETKLLTAVEYDIDYARTHVHAALGGLDDRDTTREWITMRLEHADRLLTGAVQRLWTELGWGPLPVGTAADQKALAAENDE